MCVCMSDRLGGRKSRYNPRKSLYLLYILGNSIVCRYVHCTHTHTHTLIHLHLHTWIHTH